MTPTPVRFGECCEELGAQCEGCRCSMTYNRTQDSLSCATSQFWSLSGTNVSKLYGRHWKLALDGATSLCGRRQAARGAAAAPRRDNSSIRRRGLRSMPTAMCSWPTTAARPGVHQRRRLCDPLGQRGYGRRTIQPSHRRRRRCRRQRVRFRLQQPRREVRVLDRSRQSPPRPARCPDEHDEALDRQSRNGESRDRSSS